MSSAENVSEIATTTSEVFIPPVILIFFLTFNGLVCVEFIALLGIVGNIINIISFSKEGFKDSLNITLTALAVSDLGALVIQMIVNILFAPFWKNVDLPYISFLQAIFFYPRGYFIRVSGLITLFATFERCLCVLSPMKVKTIITRPIAVTVNCLIFLSLLFYMFLPYIFSYPDWIFDPKLNKTKIFLHHQNNYENIVQVSYFVTDLFIPHSTIFLLILCNAFIIFKLKSKAKWRHTVTGINPMSGRERRLGVMLTTVSTIFIACLTPQSAMMTALAIVRDLKLNGRYFDISLLVYSFTLLLETVNCSVNILVYYTMSSKFRERIQLWFPFLRSKSEEKRPK